MGGVIILNKVLRVGLTKTVPSENFEGFKGRVFQAEGSASAKAQRQSLTCMFKEFQGSSWDWSKMSKY